ncbi:hypothetical protein ZIOFF_065705 [Zingiber officinale]|uniref:Uncharacterized protein n=1 Tax=Zingiber officinale TaxID=94328 RepID=A0A8J5KDC4_ZINOF|nr:hypothetical protein ZIOFF_065705 [Zingiber officinale]
MRVRENAESIAFYGGFSMLLVYRPLKFVTAEYNGSLPSLVYHPYSWTKVANIIFVDSPLGSGFSYSRKYEGYDANDTIWSEQASKFLLQWLVEHPQFISNPLYIAGDSYAGKIVPMVAKRILDGIDEGKEPLLNLQVREKIMTRFCERRRKEKLGGRRNQKRLQFRRCTGCLEDAQVEKTCSNKT